MSRSDFWWVFRWGFYPLRLMALKTAGGTLEEKVVLLRLIVVNCRGIMLSSESLFFSLQDGVTNLTISFVNCCCFQAQFGKFDNWNSIIIIWPSDHFWIFIHLFFAPWFRSTCCDHKKRVIDRIISKFSSISIKSLSIFWWLEFQFIS